MVFRATLSGPTLNKYESGTVPVYCIHIGSNIKIGVVILVFTRRSKAKLG